MALAATVNAMSSAAASARQRSTASRAAPTNCSARPAVSTTRAAGTRYASMRSRCWRNFQPALRTPVAKNANASSSWPAICSGVWCSYIEAVYSRSLEDRKMAKQRISYVPLEQMDADMRKEMERCQREGTPRPESSAVRAHVKACFWFFANSWRDLFKNGVLQHPVKELCRLYVSRAVTCEYCGNQRSVKAAAGGMVEDDVRDLMQFEKSKRYDERQKAALAYAEAIVYRLDTDDAFWERMHRHFSEPELVELGCVIGLTMGQQSWLRLLNIEHHQVLAGTTASMAPGYETADQLRQSKAGEDYWAKRPRQ